ncbi:hypothetical protein HK19_00320 [Acetobacter persici]|nr:hypothetical protein HK19_00320 [Acetobacter persici]
MQPPGHFGFLRQQRNFSGVGKTSRRPQFPCQWLDDPRLNQFQIALRNTDALQAGEHEDSDPVIAEDCLQIGPVELCKALLECDRAVSEQYLPFNLPASEIDFFIDPVDQGLFGREVAEEILMRDTQPFRQVAQPTVESDLGEECDGTINDLTLTVFRIEATPLPLRRS